MLWRSRKIQNPARPTTADAATHEKRRIALRPSGTDSAASPRSIQCGLRQATNNAAASSAQPAASEPLGRKA